MPAASPAAAALQLPFFWHPDHKPDEKDYHVAFRGEFELPAGGEVSFQLFGATWFTGWIDGRYFCEGPARFPAAFPGFRLTSRNSARAATCWRSRSIISAHRRAA